MQQPESTAIDNSVLADTVDETLIKNEPTKRELAILQYKKSMPSSEAIESCKAKGGEMQKQGRMQQYGCGITYSDAGKQCQDDADYEGRCYGNRYTQSGLENPFGQCAKTSNKFGRHQRIKNGVAEPTLCID